MISKQQTSCLSFPFVVVISTLVVCLYAIATDAFVPKLMYNHPPNNLLKSQHYFNHQAGGRSSHLVVDVLVQWKSKPRFAGGVGLQQSVGHRMLRRRSNPTQRGSTGSTDRKGTILTQNPLTRLHSSDQEDADERPPTTKESSIGIPKAEGEQEKEKMMNEPLAAVKDNNNNNNKKKKKQQQQQKEKQKQQQQQQPTWIVQQFNSAQQNMDQTKRQIQSIIDEPVVECAEAVLILLSSILVAVTTLPNLPPELVSPVEIIQQTLAYVFLTDFLTRWFSCTSKKGGMYITQPLVLVDIIVVVLPLLLPLLEHGTAMMTTDFEQSGLINLRLLRVLRLQRNLKDEMTFSKFVNTIRQPWWFFQNQRSSSADSTSSGRSSVIVQSYELQLARVILSIFTLLSVAAGLIYTTEHNVNPNIDDYFTALYFSLVTLTTVGFGDITPMTWEGKLTVSASILAGITIIPAQAASLVEALLQRGEEEQRREQQRSLYQQRQRPILADSPQVSAAATTGETSLQQQQGSVSTATLEVTQKCPTCGVGLHWSHATYCYNCASPLKTEVAPTLVLPDSQP